jgi:hypothetical protein
MTALALEAVLSKSRLSTYRSYVTQTIGNDDLDKALELYAWNAKTSSAYLLPLHIYEVVLRNAIADAISLRYGANWAFNSYFENSLPNPAHGYSQRKDLISVRNQHAAIGKIIPELKFAFWEHMLTQRHDGRIWDAHIKTVFPFLPAAETTEQSRTKLNGFCYNIRKIRNRIAHHEPIFNQGALNTALTHIVTSIGFRSAEATVWLKKLESVSQLLASKPF